MKRTWLILVSALLISACSESTTSGTGGSGGAGGNGGTGGSAPISYPLLDCDPLVPDFCGYPFPSNVYTVEDSNTASDENNTQWLLHMRDTAFELIGEDGPEYTIDSVEASTDEGAIDPVNIAFRIFGTFRVPLFMTSPEAGSLLLLDDADMPMINQETPWADIPFEVLIPQSATMTRAATIEYGHGLFGEKEQIESGHFATFMNKYNYIFFGTDLQGMSEPDQGAVTEALLGGKFSDVQTMWDRLHQGFLNHLVMLRMMKTSFAQDTTFGQYIKADEAYYYGISQGGIMGSVILATSPDIERGALGVMGQPYSFLLFRSVDFDIFLDVIHAIYPDYRMNQLLIGIAQMLWDRVEPNGYTHHISENTLPGVNPKEVLMRAAIGDFQVTTFAAHVMARTLKARHVDSGLQEAGIRDNPWGLTTVENTASGNFFMEYDFGLPGQPFCNVPMSLCDDPHGDLRKREAARKQLNGFLKNGTGANHCLKVDPDDDHDAVGDGVCSFPSLAECDMGETEEDTQALCIPEAP